MNEDVRYTTMSFKCWHGEYTVSVPQEAMTLGDLMDEVVQPLLLAVGYHPKTIDDYWERN